MRAIQTTKVYIEINGTVMKYETKKSTPDLCGNSCGKKPPAEEKSFTMNQREFTKYIGIENKS